MQHIIASNSKSGTRARLLLNELLARRSQVPPSYKRASSSLEQACYHSSCPNYFDAASVTTFALPSTTTLPNHSTRRLFWSSTDVEKATEEAPSHPLPVPPLTPSNLSATSLIAPSTVESLKSLPECQSVLDLLNGSSTFGEPARVKEAHSNLQRARDILQSLPELQVATHLLEVDLLSFCGKFDLALEALARYKHLKNNLSTEINTKENTQLQFMRAKLLVHSGQFAHALSEYEDLLEDMEREVERQMEGQQEENSEEGDQLSVIHGAAAMTGVGVTKLLIHAREASHDGGHESNAAKSEIIESIETATDMLLESRKEAVLSPKHAQLAVDLGLAASISLTNLGIAHCLLSTDDNNNKRSIEYWKSGLETLDTILHDAMHSYTIIPNYTFQSMESVRARLYCNISWALLGFDALHSLERKGGTLEKVSDETLKEASEAAKKALDIGDELINGPKMLRDDGINDGSTNDDAEGNDKTTDEQAPTRQEWEKILKEKAQEQRDNGLDSTNDAPKELTLSPLWAAYHRAESARALGLVAHCYASAEAAVTAEGLFQSALDASSSYPLGQSLNSRDGSGGKGVSSSSPNLGLIARDVRLWYAMLCDNWEKREGDADRLRLGALKIEEEGVLKGFVRGASWGEGDKRMSVSGLESSLWLLSPLDFER